MTVDEATEVLAALEGALDAFSELSAEHNGKRAANWGKANAGLLKAEQMATRIRERLNIKVT